MIATTGSEEKREKLEALGADAVINYHTTPEWHAAVRELTEGRGANLVVDVAATLDQSWKAVAIGGEVALIGFLAGAPDAPLDAMTLFRSAATTHVVYIGNRTQFEAMNQAIEVNDLRPAIDRVFEFEQAPEAFRHYERQPFGQVVIAHD